ncbi:hypothetical protein E2542_SST30887 [Spatholobus suberectus]|nr:hypothetical protein E2542_SST30887 [Spatholobus suberectus]
MMNTVLMSNTFPFPENIQKHSEAECISLLITIKCVFDSSMGIVEKRSLSKFGSGTRKGLFYSEWKKKTNEKPCTVTLAHYYANSNSGGKILPPSRIDIGLSIMAKIRVSHNSHLDFTVDEHPSSALFYMFEEVNRTWDWKPTACPHCAEIQIQRQRRWTPWQSESEDSDSHPAAPVYGRRQKARNNGLFVGDANGSIFERNMMVFLKKFIS